MASYNRVVLVGNLTRDIQLRHTPAGTAVTDVGLAINEKVKRGENYVDETVFVDITLFGRTAEVAGQYLSKGSNVLIEGRLKLDTWEKDGLKHSKLKVIADNLKMLGSKGEGIAKVKPEREYAPASAPARAGDEYDDDIPF